MLDAIETASRDEIQALQLKRLKASLRKRLARNVAGPIEAKFEAAGVHPKELKRLEDLASFPFTGKADLRDNYPASRPVAGARCARIRAASTLPTARRGSRPCDRLPT